MLTSCSCKWSCKSLEWLRDLEGLINQENILDQDRSHNMSKVLEYHLSIIEGTEGRYATLQEESEASTNMVRIELPLIVSLGLKP